MSKLKFCFVDMLLSGFLNFEYDKVRERERERSIREECERIYFSKENWSRKEERKKNECLPSCAPGKAERQVSDKSSNHACICKLSSCNQDSM